MVDNITSNALREKPMFLKTHAEVRAFLNGKMKKNMVLQEDNCTLSTNNSYRNQTTYEVSGNDKEKLFLDFGFLIRDETSSLKGSLDSENDVDFYNFTIPYNRTYQNYFNIEIHMELPEGSDYRLTLYDEYGNQVGNAEWNGNNQKTINIPNWDTKTSKYCIKIENEMGNSVNPGNYYKINFHVSENKDAEKTDAIREAFLKCNNDYSKKNDDWKDSLAEYNRLLQEAEKNYVREVELLHEKQYNNLPEEKKYKGDRTVDELLQSISRGEKLSVAELEYVKIYSNLKDIEKAQQRSRLNNDLSLEFVKDLKGLGISEYDLEHMKVQIGSNGKVIVENIDNNEIRKQVENLIEERYDNQLYRYYIGIADSVNELPSNVYQFALDVQEVERFLSNASNKEVSLSDLHFMPDGSIGGLPQNISDMINKTKDNAKIEGIKTAMQDIISYAKTYGNSSIPVFCSNFQFENGVFSVVDTGFANDVNQLSERMNSIKSRNNMYVSVYNYRFKKVL